METISALEDKNSHTQRSQMKICILVLSLSLVLSCAHVKTFIRLPDARFPVLCVDNTTKPLHEKKKLICKTVSFSRRGSGSVSQLSTFEYAYLDVRAADQHCSDIHGNAERLAQSSGRDHEH